MINIFMQKNFELAPLLNYQVGGSADYFVSVSSKIELRTALNWSRQRGIDFFILGGGTNILVSDKGYRGLIIKINFNQLHFNENNLYAGAGVLMSDLVRVSIDHGFAGLEWAAGLPGTLGGAIRGNAGCFGGEIKDAVAEVKVINLLGQEIIFKNQDCDFSYRQSRFKLEPFIITEAVLSLRQSPDQQKTVQLAQENIAYRYQYHPMDCPSCGSVFKNCPVAQAPDWVVKKYQNIIKIDPFPVIPVAGLISDVDLKGYTIGGAKISEKHPNFIVNFNQAKAEDIFSLIVLVRKEIKQKFGMELETEVQLVGF